MTIVLVALLGGPSPANASSGDEPAPTPTEVPVVTANPFLPEEADLTSCIGMLQRPGCGSEERGGWRQYAVAVVMVGGLVIVFGRVFWGVARNRRKSELPS